MDILNQRHTQQHFVHRVARADGLEYTYVYTYIWLKHNWDALPEDD
jgi:hypothetical protein